MFCRPEADLNGERMNRVRLHLQQLTPLLPSRRLKAHLYNTLARWLQYIDVICLAQASATDKAGMQHQFW